MEKLGVIRKIEEPTEWCHPIVAVMKPDNKIRLCIDLTKLNKGIERELYQLESVEETLARMGDECKIMSKLDASSGYWQTKLNEQSQKLTTFITPIGSFCCTRGPFGLSSMQEIFNKKMDDIIDGLPGVAKSTDDFLVYAKTEAEHNTRLHTLLQKFKEYSVTLNRSKCIFNTTEVEFLGHEITPLGITPTSAKILGITDYPTPQNLTELHRFMGMPQQMSKYTDELAPVAEPLRELLSTKNQWLWTSTYIKAFEKILTLQKTLKLYDAKRQTKLRVEYYPGKEMTDADALSRAPTEAPTKEDQLTANDIETQVNTVIQTMPATSSRLTEIRYQTKIDPELQSLKNVTHEGWPNSRQQCPIECRPFYDNFY